MNKSFPYIPNEIINIIFSYIERPKHVQIIKYIIKDGYDEDYNPYTAENWTDNYCFQYSFYEWYYLYRMQSRLGGIIKRHKITKNINNYRHTHEKLLIGHDKLLMN
jgi:hypothetical protein